MNLALTLATVLVLGADQSYQPGHKIAIIRVTALKIPPGSSLLLNPGGPATITQISEKGFSIEGLPGFLDPEDVMPMSDALAYFNSVIDDSTNDPRMYDARASIYFDSQQWEDAAKDYQKAIDLSPNGFRHNMRGNVMAKLHRYDEAISHFNEALRFFPKDTTAILSRASCKCDQGMFKEAIDDCLKARSFGTMDFYAYAVLAAVYAKAGEFEKAAESQEHAVDLARDDKEKVKSQEKLELYRAGKIAPDK